MNPIIAIAIQKGKNTNKIVIYGGVSVKKPKLKANPAKYVLIEAMSEYKIAMTNQLVQ